MLVLYLVIKVTATLKILMNLKKMSAVPIAVNEKRFFMRKKVVAIVGNMKGSIIMKILKEEAVIAIRQVMTFINVKVIVMIIVSKIMPNTHNRN